MMKIDVTLKNEFAENATISIEIPEAISPDASFALAQIVEKAILTSGEVLIPKCEA
jgi:hypothetical protein